MPKEAFNTQTTSQIVESIRIGNYKSTAAQLSGISYRTLTNWLKKGREEPEGNYGQFYLDVLKAEAEFEANAVSELTMSGNPKYLLEVLSRRSPEKWSATSRVNVQVNQKIEDFMNFLCDALSDEPDTLKRVLEIASNYSPEGENE
jgi:hypothetical protein